MLVALAALSAINLICIIVLLVRRPSAPVADARTAQAMDALTHLQGRIDALDGHLRASVNDLRREQGEAAQRAHDAAGRAATELRGEVTNAIASLNKMLQEGFGGFRTEHTASGETLRGAVEDKFVALGQRLSGFITDVNSHQAKSQDLLHTRLNDLGTKQTEGLDRINRDNAAKLEEMRVTVDEKLHATLQTRLTESFGQVTTHLGEVQKGLGEMKELATGVSDLKKVFSNVKSRGVVGEFQLGMQLEQMFSAEQYVKNAKIKPNTGESVEFALKIPDGDSGSVLLPIDAKFPREDWERLEHAYDHGTTEEQAKAGTAFERAIRTEGKRICEKYIDPPQTLPFAIMFLPTEALYAEVMRRPGLHTELQSSCNVTIAGPSSFMAILTSFQMGFRTIAIQKKGHEVWNILSATKSEFEKFGGLMDKVEKQVGTVQNTLGEIGRKTKTINRTLRDVGKLEAELESASAVLAFEDIAGVAPLLAASEE